MWWHSLDEAVNQKKGDGTNNDDDDDDVDNDVDDDNHVDHDNDGDKDAAADDNSLMVTVINLINNSMPFLIAFFLCSQQCVPS